MPLGGTQEEKEQRAAAKAAQREAQAAERANAAWWSSPIGLAYQAKQEGAAFFQVEIEIGKVGAGWGAASTFGSSAGSVRSTGGRPDVLGQIEEYGWRLEHVGYVFVQTGATSSNRIGSTGQGVVTRGQVMGIYLFRSA